MLLAACAASRLRAARRGSSWGDEADDHRRRACDPSVHVRGSASTNRHGGPRGRQASAVGRSWRCCNAAADNAGGRYRDSLLTDNNNEPPLVPLLLPEPQ